MIVKIFRLYLIALVTAFQLNAQNVSKDTLEQKSQPEAGIDSLINILQKERTDTSKINILNEIARQYPLDQSTKIKMFADSALALAKKINWVKGQAEALNNIGDALTFESNIKEAIEKNETAVKLFESINDKIGIANSYRKIGIAYYKLSDFPKSFDYFSRALKIFQSLDNDEGTAKSLGHIAALYGTFGNQEKALEYFNEALKISEKMNNKYETAIHLGNIGVTYENLKKYDLSLRYYKKAVDIFRDINDWYDFSIFTGNIGNVYTQMKNYPEADRYYRLSLKYAVQNEDEYTVAYQYGNIGVLKYKMAADPHLNLTASERKNNLSKSIEYLNSSIDKLKSLESKDDQKYFLLELTDAYKENGDYQNALKSFATAKELEDSIFSEKNRKLISEMQIKQQLDIKEREVSTLNKEKEYKDEVNSLLTALAFLLVAVSGAIFWFYLKKKKDNAVLSENIRIRKETEEALRKNEGELKKHRDHLEKLVKLRTANLEAEIAERKRAEEKVQTSLTEKEALLEEKEILLKEIHHRVKNNLQVISSLLYLQSQYLQDEETINLFEDSRNRIQSMALVHEKLYQSVDYAEVNLKEYVENLLVQSEQSNWNHEIPVKSYIEIDSEIKLDLDTTISCGLIINELITNAYKYAFPIDWANQKPNDFEFKVFVGVKFTGDQQYEMTVRDNGIGIDKELDIENSNSLGLKIVSSMVKQLDGTIDINGSNGLEFKIKFSRPGKLRLIKKLSQL